MGLKYLFIAKLIRTTSTVAKGNAMQCNAMLHNYRTILETSTYSEYCTREQ